MHIGTWLYTVGAFVMWVLVGPIFGWPKGVVSGSTVALIGVVCIFVGLLGEGAKFAVAFFMALTLSSLPIGILVGNNGGSGFWTVVWIAGIGGFFLFLIRLGHLFEKKYGT